MPDVRGVVFRGIGGAIREAHVAANEAAALVGEGLKGTQFGALRGKGVQFVAMRAQELERERGVSGVVLRTTGGGGLAIPREAEGVGGEAHEP